MENNAQKIETLLLHSFSRRLALTPLFTIIPVLCFLQIKKVSIRMTFVQTSPHYPLMPSSADSTFEITGSVCVCLNGGMAE